MVSYGLEIGAVFGIVSYKNKLSVFVEMFLCPSDVRIRTLQAPEFDEQDRLADAPVEKTKTVN